MKPAPPDIEHLRIRLVQHILRDLGSELCPHATILDFGCGNGMLVYQLRKEAYNAFGVDILNEFEGAQKRCEEEGLIADDCIFHAIPMDQYRIPFEDNTFDCVISFYVLEHVQNWEQALDEIKRILKPGGTSLHIFPSRYSLIEPHVFVPLASLFQGYHYLAFWAFWGIRNSYQTDKSWREAAKMNVEYLRTYTKYYPKAEIRRLVAGQFERISFPEGIYIKHHFGRVRRYLYPLSRTFPWVASLFSTFYTRVLFFQK